MNELGIDEWIGLQLIKYNKNNIFIEEFTNVEKVSFWTDLALFSKKNKLTFSINPKALRPMTVEYINKKNNTGMKLPEHMCNAGLTFAYIDWSGRIYPCDRVIKSSKNKDIYSKNTIDEIFAHKTDLKLLFKSKLFKYFSYIYADTKIDNNFYPCKKCHFFKKQCTPCTAFYDVNRNKKIHIDECSYISNDKINEIINKIPEEEKSKIYNIDCDVDIYVNEKTSYVFDHKQNEVYDISNLSKILLDNIYKNTSVQFHVLLKDVLFDYSCQINIFRKSPEKLLKEIRENIKKFKYLGLISEFNEI
ncbi:MAG: hypothetical protein ACOCUI_02305 [bacterium]